MKRKITFLSAAFMLLAFLAVPMGMWGQTTHTIGWGTASGEEGTYTNFTATSGEVAGVLSFITEKNSSQTNPAYNANASELRLYFHSSGDGGSITISPVSGITITDAVMTTSTSPSVAYYVDGGSAVSVSASNNTYTISGISASTSLKIQNVNTSNTQLRIKTIALTYTTDGTQPTTYTVTYHANVTGIDDVVDTYNEGANVTLRAANTFDNEGYTFEEWNTDANGDGDSYAAGDEIEDIQDDLEFYAIWTENVTPTPGGEVVDVLNLDFTGRPATSSYGDWSDKTGNSGAVYAGNSAGSNNSIQLRSNNNTSGIVTTTSGGKVTKVSVTWNSNTVSGRTLNVYGKDSAYSAASDLYGNDAGTLIGTIVCGTSTELNITNDYEFIGLRSASGAMYLDEIDITWTSGSNPAVATTTVINVPEGFNTDIYQGTEAGTLTATVSAGETTLEASVTWTSSNEAVATIDENGNVTLVAVGNTTITASYAGEDGVYRPSTATYQLTVVNTDPNVPGTQNNPYTVAQARAAIDAGTGVNGVYATGIVSEIPTAWSTQYNNITFNFVDTEGNTDFLQAFRCVSGTGVDASTVAVGDIVVVYGDLIYYTSQGIYEFAQGCQLVSLTHPAIPHITVTPSTIDAPAEGAEGTLVLAYENITDFISFDFSFCDANGGELQEDPDWIDAEIRGEDSLYYVIGANTSDARTAYIKVYTFDDDLEEVYAIVTVNQAEYVAPTYAELPFEFNGGRDDIEDTDGLYQEGLGTDYNASTAPNTRLKFDGTGDWLLLQFNERPGTLTFNVKGNSFSDGTFKVQTSEDGTTYTDLQVYTELGDTQNEEFELGENVRYIKWIYTNKSNGNVGLGNIALAEYVEPVLVPSITVTPDTLNVDAQQHLVNYFSLAYENIVADSTQCFTVHYYNAEGQEIEPVPGEAWMIAGVVKPMDIYQVVCTIIANEGEARTGYFKVSAQDANDNTVYSNLVTVNQEAAPQQYTLTVEPFENLELITFVNDEMVMEGDSTIYVTEGDQIMLSIVADEGYVLETLMVNGVNHVNDIADDFTYSFEMPAENVTISATAVEDIPGEWVMVSLNDLTEDDVFVIVGVYDEDESSYAMPNNNGTNNAPSAVEVTMVGNTLSGDIADNLKWNLSIGEGGYTFYPEGDTATWLYCNNTNNGVRVGTNENNVFSMTSEGYLYNNATNRYIGIYNYQDWRCYTSINNNIKNQTFAFYKRVDESEIETYTLDITGYGDNEGGYYLIAPPVSMIRPTAENGFLTDEYDLYYFDQAQQGEEWRNYKAKKFFPASGKGYLYASQESTMLIFTGVPYNGNGEVALDYTEGASFAGWNLIGNPFGNAATLGNTAFYKMNSTGSELESATVGSTIAAMEGVFVVAETDGETVTFTEQTNPNNNNEVSQISINVSMNRGESIDRAIVRFDNGNQLPKFQLNPNHTKVYFPQGENDYAIVRSANEGEMAVNFKAENNGTYTFSVNTENVEMDYLHLIDNMTGADVDLLATPSYSFEAKTTDYANRFRLVFNANTVNENGNETFAYFNGSEWVISNMGEATLQVVDLMGRVLSTETVNGNATMNINQTPGVYMLRLVNGDSVKVQKVVVR